MTSPLYVIALISGGKDSLFSILHCQANGHSVVALANLHPPRSAHDEDLNSYMYQTVGHAAIPLYEQALGIPLYRQEITGKAVSSSRDYQAPLAGQEQDETEDLVPLLRGIMAAHPEANALSSGAILSTYQRTRVESVALRLGLVPLSYLWQYPVLPPYTQSSLLHDMAAVGQEAIIIKTASGGLDESFLGFDVASQRTIGRLGKAVARFESETNGAILGEGGEFETLAIDGPKPLWKQRIHLEPGRPGVMEGGQAVLNLQATSLEKKREDMEKSVEALRIPRLFDDEFTALLRKLEESDDDRSIMSDNATLVNVPFSRDEDVSDTAISERLPRNASSDTSTMFTYSNLVSDTRQSVASGSCSRQLSKILSRLEHTLTQWNIDKASINHCTLLLRDMADFAVLNPIYERFFNATNPPARVTIAAGNNMPSDVDVMLSIVVDKDEKDRKGRIVRAAEREGLHVQGRSYWAPANIGPYSQAISVRLPLTNEKNPSAEMEGIGEVVYVAGQIPLVPASMQVYQPKGFRGQAALSLQHLWRIGRAKKVKWWTASVGFIPAGANPEEQVRTAQEAWRAIHTPTTPSPSDENNDNGSDSNSNDDDDDEDGQQDADIDPWDRLNRTAGHTFNDSTYRPPIPDPSAISSPTNPNALQIPPCFIAQVHSLPRGVDIEWSATGLTSPSIHFTRSLAHANLTTTSLWPSLALPSRSAFYTLELQSAADMDVLRRLGGDSVRDWSAATLYAARGFEWSAKLNLRAVQWVPCERVWGDGGREVSAVLVGRVDRDGEREGSVMGRFVSSLRFSSQGT